MSRSLLVLLLALATFTHSCQIRAGEVAGSVFHDRNQNGVRDAGERGIGGVRVSNQRDIVLTDAQGRWRLPTVGAETTFFVIKPRGWMAPTNHHGLPRFFYTHKPAGSPPLKYPGLAPTGPLPASIDFALRKQDEPDRFQALFFGDTQPRDLREVQYIAHDTVEELVGRTRARFGVTLGDIVFDDLSVMEPLNATIALIGLPWWNVIGNHDVNTDAPTETDFDDTYNRIYGPNYFSFDYGAVHFVALDNVNWLPPADRGTNGATWRAGLDARQLEWLGRDLALTPPKQLVLLMMHIPLTDMTNRAEVYRLIEQRPYCLSISGHTHWHEHRFVERADGWRGPEPHHHIVTVTVCGSWFTGQPDELGIPHTTMRDGAPNGYAILNFDRRGARVEFKASRQPASYQMNIMTPETVAAGDLGSASGSASVYVNVFNGSKRSQVQMRWNDRGPWLPLEKVLEEDPSFVAVRKREPEKPAEPFRVLSAPIKSPHLWKARLPAGVGPGTHALTVRATDVNGRWHRADRQVVVK